MNDTLTGLFSAISGAPDLIGALCVGEWQTFDETDDPEIVARAVELCQACPALAQCREWSRTLSNRRLSGVVAGTVRPWSPSSDRSGAAA